ncbi:hypothetical protein C8R45DRAFT_1115253 [Mycena sanguinolenta]|nr:hypothetical protein C8R45DRAFT_1115253 [Mycena sanguinolenta]
MASLSNLGIPFPIPADHDFAPWMKKPNDVVPPDGMDLKSRNEDNSAMEIHNRESLRATRYFISVVDKTGLDVGLALLPYWLYSAADIELMVKSTRICDAVGPLPTYLCLLIETSRFRRAEADEDEKRDREKERADREKFRAEKEKAKSTPVIGNMLMTAPVVRTPGLRAPVVVPQTILLTVFHRLNPPLNWFTDDRLRFADKCGHELGTKGFTPLATLLNPAPVKVTVLDMAKMIVMWDTDESHSCLSALSWIEATLNFQATLDELSPLPSDPPFHTFAGEFRKHRTFFLKLLNFERDYPLWYQFEREMRQQVLDSILVDETYYAMHVQIILSSHLAVQSSLGMSTSRSPGSSPLKRSGDFESTERTGSKVLKSTYESQAHGSFQEQGDSFRDSQNMRPPEGSNRASSCFLCAGPHRVADHPSDSTTFSDGKPLFTCRMGTDLLTAKPFQGLGPKKICGSFNVGRGCQGNHNPLEFLHVCSLCGKDHPALSRDPDCTRVSLGVLLP